MSLKRFPIAIGLSTAATITLIVLTHNEGRYSSDTRELLGHIAMALALGIPLTLCTKLIFERKTGVKTLAKASIYLVEALGLVLYYFFLLKDFSMVSVSRYIGISLCLYLAFIIMPYYFRRDGFELYVIRLLTRFFTTIIYAVVLFLGIDAILFTIDKLFEIRIDGRIYRDVWLGVVGIFSPSFFLAGIPLYEEELEGSTYPKLLKVLLLYIVMPLTAIYTAILYVYFAKILVTLQWPIGMVAHLTLWYSVICAAIIFLISPLTGENKWVRSFVFWLPKVIIPLLIMMFVSIGIRVKAYGITENRYFVIVLGLWALGTMIYLNLARIRRNIILLVTLSLIALLSVVGPWSSYSVSVFSQNQRLEGLLQKYDMLGANGIVKEGKEVAVADKKEISEILSYFSRFHSLGEVKHLPKDFKISQMKDVLGFESTESNYIDRNRKFFSYNNNMVGYPIDIKGYSYMFSMNSYNPPATSSVDGIEIKYDNKVNEVVVFSSGKEVYRKSLVDFVKQINKKYGTNNKNIIDARELSFVDENENVRVKFIFNHIDGYEDENETGVSVASMDLFFLVGLK